MTDKIDLRDLMKQDKPMVIKPEDMELDKEQKLNGHVMDDMVKKEHYLMRNKQKIMGDDSLFLYRLPLNETQMANVYNNLIKI